MRSTTLIVLLLSLITSTGLLWAANTWQGTNTAWGTPGNWSTGAVPTTKDLQDIVIPAGTVAYPTLTADVMVDGSVTINAGATLRLNGHILSLGGFPVNNTKGVFNSGTLDASVDGAVLVLGHGGFVNSGVVTGHPTLNFMNYCFDAPITAGGAEFAGIQLDGMNYAYRVTLTDNTTIHGDVNITGGHLVIGTGARMTIKGNLNLNVTGTSAAMSLIGDIQLYGNITGSGNAVGFGSSAGWVSLISDQDQQISGAGAVLPPIRVAKAGGKAVVNGNLICAGLQVDTGNTLDLTACQLVTFTSSYARGLLNSGTLLGQPKLFFSAGSYNALLKSGGATFGGIDIETGNVANGPTLQDNASVVGDITLRRGYINIGNYTLSLNGSLSMAKVPAVNTDSVRLSIGAQGLLAFVGAGTATLDPGGTQQSYWYRTSITNMSVNKPGGTLVITGAPAEVTGSFTLTAGTISFTNGGELWLFTYRNSNYRLLDIGLRLLSDITPEQFPPLTSLEIGPAIPADTKLTNVAPTSVLSSQPYVSMIEHVVDNDPAYRTAITPETGLPANIFRLFLKFSKPQDIASISWVVPNGPWALLADCDGDGTCETLLRADLKGVFNVSTWADRQVITNYFWPTMRAYKVMFVNPKNGGMSLFDIKVLSTTKPSPSIGKPPSKMPPRIPIATEGTPMSLSMPTPAQQLLKGFDIETWMFDYLGWTQKTPRPALSQYPAFQQLIASLHYYHANFVNLWPARNVGGPARGPGVYENDVLWPSQYDKHPIPTDDLAAIAAALKAEGITCFSMDRVMYPKPLADFPPSPTRDLPAPYLNRQFREYWAGYAKEEAAQGVDGVGVGFDEEYESSIGYPGQADDYTRQVFTAQYGMTIPAQREDTPAFRRWVLFAYDQFAGYLQGMAQSARSVNPNIKTHSPVTMLDTMWNDRIDWGVAHDVIGHAADIDVLRASGYEDWANLGHYVTAASVKRAIAATKSRGAISLHNCPWASDPVGSPGYYRSFTPIFMYSPLSAFMNGAKIAAFWRYNFIFYGGYDQYVKECYTMLDTLGAWGMKDALPSPEVVVLKSRASEDWWQIRCRYNPDGNPMDQTLGFLNEKWTLEFLLTRGYSFEMRYLDHPEDLQDLGKYKMIIIPFAYSISNEAYSALVNAVGNQTKLIVLGGQGETDEFGDARATPLLADMLARNKNAKPFTLDPMQDGHNPVVLEYFRIALDTALGTSRQLTFDSHGEDVEVSLLTKDARTKFVSVINWADGNAQCDLCVKLPVGQYRVYQADAEGARELMLNGRAIWTDRDLRSFRLPMNAWQAKALYIHPAQ